MLAPILVTAPDSKPVMLDEVKKHLRVDFDDDDALINALIAAATDHLDGYTGLLGRALVTQTWRQDFRCFGDRLALPLWPVAEIESVVYYDSANVEQTLSVDVYELLADARGACVALKPDQSWPSVYSRADAVRVTYIAGVAAEAVPPAIRAAIMLHVGHLYENREAVAKAGVSLLPLGVAALIAPYRRVGI